MQYPSQIMFLLLHTRWLKGGVVAQFYIFPAAASTATWRRAADSAVKHLAWLQ